MTFKCNTADTGPWASKINNTTDDGTFTIEAEDDKGRFRGAHSKNRQTENIRGGCHADGIWFLLPAVRPQFLYSGKFVNGNTNEISGFRVSLGEVSAAGDDDWVATRPPTN